jgi:anti-anti-sigma factor
VTVSPVEGRTDGVRVLRGSGELDAVTAPPLLATVGALVDGAVGVVLDLRNVSFFDSSGVRLVDRLARECGRRGSLLRVVAPRGVPARRVLEIVGLAEALVADTEAEAVAAVRP